MLLSKAVGCREERERKEVGSETEVETFQHGVQNTTMADAYWELTALARSCANAVGQIIFFSFIMILDEDALVTTVLTGKDIGAQNTVERLLLWDQDLKSGSLAQEVLFRSCQGWSLWK